jgi:ribosomal protein S13
LAEQRIQSESEAFNAEERTSVRDLTTEFLSNSITAIMQIMDQFIDNDLDWQRSSKAKRGVLDMISCYQELLHERKLKRKSTLDAYIKKKQRFAEEPQTTPSSKM